MLLSTYDFETFWSFHPRFSTILRPFVVICHVETMVVLRRNWGKITLER